MTLKTLNIEGVPVDPRRLVGDPHALRPLFEGFLRFSGAKRVLDPTGGSHVVKRVCEERDLEVVSSDLNDASGGRDLFEHDEEESFDMIWFHSDYWMSRPDASHPHDLGGTMTWDAYVDLAADAVEHLATLLRPGGHLVAICPLSRRRGVIGDLARDLTMLLGSPSQPPLVHPHPSCRATGTMFGRRYIPIAHDNVVVWTREDLYAPPGSL